MSVADYTMQIDAAAAKYGIDPNLITAVMTNESGGDPNALSKTGAVGLMQLEPGTAAGLGVNPYDPAQNIDGGAHYLADQLAAFGGNTSLAVAAYNAGPGAVVKYGGVPPYTETQTYVKRVLATMSQLGSNVSGGFVIGDQVGGPGATVAGTTYPATSGQPGVTPPVNVTPMQSAQPAGNDPFGIGRALTQATGAITSAATNIATEVFLGALALAFISGGILWLASSNSGVRSTIAKAAA